MNLTDYVKRVSEEDFGLPFKHEAKWNSRLRTTGGRFFLTDGHLDFNPKIYEAYELSIFRQIVRHELCHYHLYFQGKGYRHQDDDFKQLLRSVDGLRYTPRLTPKLLFSYCCDVCGQTYHRRRRFNLERYRCGSCRGRLFLKNQSYDG
ncbi:SprT family protein [Streptococcus sp. sy018]|uniref:SprT family protein n=1 Tax=Streptococcus sp. sy018 TaxID=2600147 RepID=UPI0011B7AD17|nr:SprT family protein [Streptococcus sp. sy018]TWS94186.1 SprT family protein [Streptococcus sp. sy018]